MPNQPHAVDLHVGARLRLGRDLGKVSLKSLGQAAGVTFQQVQKYERGTNRISASVLLAFARRLGRPIDWFFEGLDPTGPVPAAQVRVQAFMAVREAPELLKALVAVPPDARRKLIALIREAADRADETAA